MKEITEFLKKCPCFAGKNVREDLLTPQPGSVAIAPDGGSRIVKKYASGDSLEQICFKMMMRENFGGEAGKLLETLEKWLADGSEKLPDEVDGIYPQFIEITEGPTLVKTEVGAGVYEMKLRLVYYRKGVK